MKSSLALMLLSLLLIGSAFAQTPIGYCYVSPTAGNAARGKITWVSVSGGNSFVFDLQGLGANAVRGFHAHTYGSIYTNNATAVGGHFDPRRTATHANLVDGIAPELHHAGDFGNVTAAANGTAMYQHDATFTEITTSASVSIHGRALIIHANPDFGVYYNTTNGNAGSRIGQCVVQTSSYGNFYVPDNVMFASADVKVDMYSEKVNGRITFEKLDASLINVKARLCSLPRNFTVSIVVGKWDDVMDNSTFTTSTYSSFQVTSNMNGVVDADFNTTDITLGQYDKSVLAKGIAVMDVDKTMILARGIVGISNVRVPLNAPQGSYIYQTCETSGPGPQPGGSTGPGPQPGSGSRLFMGISTIMLLIASFLLF